MCDRCTAHDIIDELMEDPMVAEWWDSMRDDPDRQELWLERLEKVVRDG